MCPLRKNYTKAEIRKQTISKIRSVQTPCEDYLFRGNIKMSVIINGKTKADGDNVFKGVADALQGILFENDRQIVEGYFKHNR